LHFTFCIYHSTFVQIRKFILILLFLGSCNSIFAQEFNVGGGVGINFLTDDTEYPIDKEYSPAISALIEFRPKHAIFSISSEIRPAFGENYDIKFPLHLNFIIGKKVNVILSLGGYVSAKGNYGGMFGTGVQFPLIEKIKPFFRYELFSERYEDFAGGHSGNSTDTFSRIVQYFAIGVKFNLLKSE
jgi:hypothetical protein